MITVNAYQGGRLPSFRQTFGCGGKVRGVQFSTDDLGAEWQLVGSPMPDLSPLAGKKILYIQNETPDYYLPPLAQLKQCAAILTPLQFNDVEGVPQFVGPACLQWMYGIRVEMRQGVGHYYHPTEFLSLEEMIEAQFVPKARICSIIVTAKTFLPGHKRRIEFVKRLANHFGNRIDIYGFGFRPLLDKREAIDPYLFSIAIEKSAYVNYVTEKLSDVYLGYAMPIYHGAPNAAELFPADSMLKIDIGNLDETIAQIDGLISQPEKFNLAAVKEARRRVLMEYNCFHLIARVVEQMELRSGAQKVDGTAA